MTKFLIIEDHALVREGLRLTLDKLDGEKIISEALDAEEALRLLESGEAFDLILLDLLLPGISGLSFLGVLRKRFPRFPVIVLSAVDDYDTVSRAMRQGASGFVAKSRSREVLLHTLEQVLAGRVCLPMHLPEQVVSKRKGKGGGATTVMDSFGLTQGQLRVLRLLVEGKSNREIGDLLGLTEGTIKVHVSNIFKTMKVSNRAQAMIAFNKGNKAKV